jgi:protein-S-isoprenylcysteine O-methyltransferase Ste14
MDAPNAGKTIANKSPAITLKLPGISISFTGLLALIPLVILLALAALLVAYVVRSATWSWLWVSGGLWILFIGYWSAAARRAAPTKSSESAASRQLHQLLMYGALALAFWRAPWLGGRWLPAAAYIVAIGLALQVSSALLAVWARKHLGRNWSGEITAKVDHQLIRTGPYRLVRHPIYSAMLGMFLGTALVSGELHGLLAVVIIAVAYWRKIRLEEQHLRTVFGAAYDDYRKKSWALIPWVL